MDYEKKYKEALERAKATINVNPSRQNEVTNLMVTIFPELAESEDERIRKKVIEVLKLNIKEAESQMQASRGVNRTFEVYACNKVIAYLEKQKKDISHIFKAGDIIANKITKHRVKIEGVDLKNQAYYYSMWDGAATVHSDFPIGEQDEWEFYSIDFKDFERPTISRTALSEGIAHFGITQHQIDNWLKKYIDIKD